MRWRGALFPRAVGLHTNAATSCAVIDTCPSVVAPPVQGRPNGCEGHGDLPQLSHRPQQRRDTFLVEQPAGVEWAQDRGRIAGCRAATMKSSHRGRSGSTFEPRSGGNG